MVPELFAVGLRAAVFLLHLGWVADLEDGFLSVLFWDLDLVDCHVVKEGRDDFPWHWDAGRSVDDPEFKESASVVERDFL